MRDIICIEDTPWFSKMNKASQTNVKEYLVSTFSTQLCQNTSGNAYIDMQISSNLLMVHAKDYATKMGFIEKSPPTMAELLNEAFPDARHKKAYRMMVMEETKHVQDVRGYYGKRADELNHHGGAIIDMYVNKDTGEIIIQHHPVPFSNHGHRRALKSR